MHLRRRFVVIFLANEDVDGIANFAQFIFVS